MKAPLDEFARQVAKWAKARESRLNESTRALYIELMVDWVKAVWDAATKAAPAPRASIIAHRRTIGWRVWGELAGSLERFEPVIESFRATVRTKRLRQLAELRRARRRAAQ